MNKLVTESFGVSQPMLRRSELYNLLDALCHEIELSDSQFNAAKANYEAVGNWLAGSEHESLKKLDIYVHGSTILGTTVKPIGRDEHDVDLICHVPGFSPARSPAELKKLIGDRLRANGKYAAILEEKKRCWRLNYAREFHLDISPTVPNRSCVNGGELVPDKTLREWKPTNPKGYRKIFERRADLMPSLRILKAFAMDAQANIDPFPSKRTKKGILRRTVQLLKRHRDIAFMTVEEDIAPISIIITTLASQAYEMCVGRFEFNTELDVVIETIRMMPIFIERRMVGGKNLWIVDNESTTGENFAERWNSEPARARAFYGWHKQALEDFERFATLEGVDLLTKELSKSLGSKEVGEVFNGRTCEISEARSAMKLFVAPTVGLTVSSPARATQVLRNTNFGDR